jgi:hypothetical protein
LYEEGAYQLFDEDWLDGGNTDICPVTVEGNVEALCLFQVSLIKEFFEQEMGPLFVCLKRPSSLA